MEVYYLNVQYTRACLKIHSCNLHAPLRGIFGPNSLNVARYAALIWAKSPTKWNVHLTQSNFQTRSSLNGRQKALLEKLPGFGDTIIVNKRDISLKDLAAITADTGNEFAMFSMRGRRFIMRGDSVSVPIDEELVSVLAAKGWRWSAHSHPGMSRTVLAPSENDRAILKIFKNQTYSSTDNSVGSYRRFSKDWSDWLPDD